MWSNGQFVRAAGGVTGQPAVCAALGMEQGGIQPGFLYGLFRQSVFPMLGLCGVPEGFRFDFAGYSKINVLTSKFNSLVPDPLALKKAAAEVEEKNRGKTADGPRQLLHFLLKHIDGKEGVIHTIATKEITSLGTTTSEEFAVHFLLDPDYLPATRELRTANGTLVARENTQFLGVTAEHTTNLELATAIALAEFCKSNVEDCAEGGESRLKFWVIADGSFQRSSGLRRGPGKWVVDHQAVTLHPLSWDDLLKLWNQQGVMGEDLWSFKETLVQELRAQKGQVEADRQRQEEADRQRREEAADRQRREEADRQEDAEFAMRRQRDYDEQQFVMHVQAAQRRQDNDAASLSEELNELKSPLGFLNCMD